MSTAQGTTLRERVAQLAQAQAQAHSAQAQAMIAIQATAQRTMQRSNTAHSNVVQFPAQITITARSTSQRAQAEALEQARNNLSTANHIAQHNKAMGKALRSLAMRDMNVLRAKKSSWNKLAVMMQYANIGTVWAV